MQTYQKVLFRRNRYRCPEVRRHGILPYKRLRNVPSWPILDPSMCSVRMTSFWCEHTSANQSISNKSHGRFIGKTQCLHTLDVILEGLIFYNYFLTLETFCHNLLFLTNLLILFLFFKQSTPQSNFVLQYPVDPFIWYTLLLRIKCQLSLYPCYKHMSDYIILLITCPMPEFVLHWGDPCPLSDSHPRMPPVVLVQVLNKQAGIKHEPLHRFVGGSLVNRVVRTFWTLKPVPKPIPQIALKTWTQTLSIKFQTQSRSSYRSSGRGCFWKLPLGVRT